MRKLLSKKYRNESSRQIAALRDAARGVCGIDVLERRTLFAAPTAVLTPPSSVTTPAATIDFTVTYNDSDGTIDPASLGVGDPADPAYPTSPADITITGPNGFTATGVYIAPNTPPDPAATIVATYRFAAPNGRFDASTNGTYTIAARTNAVLDNSAQAVAAGTLGTFTVNVPTVSGGDFANGFATDLAVRASATQSDGKVLVAGTETYARMGSDPLGEDSNDLYTNKRLVIRRYNADGSIDTGFGTNGRVISSDAGDSDGRSILLGTGGAFYIAGGSGYPANLLSLTKFNANGTVDTSFGTNGVAQVDFDPNVAAPNLARVVATQSDGKLIVAGQAMTVNDNGDPLIDWAICRLRTNGTLDTSFGTNGIVDLDVSGTNLSDAIGAMVITPTDQIIVAGVSGTNVVVGRFNADGTADSSFGTAGLVTVAGLTSPVVDNANALSDPTIGLARLTSGDLVVAADKVGGGFGLVKLSGTSGAADTSFGTAGVATASFGGTDDADRLLLLPSGRLLALGTTTASGNVRSAVAMFNTAGTLDSQFDTDGLATYDAQSVGGARAEVSASVDSVGRIVIGRADDVGAGTLRRIAGDYAAPQVSLDTVPAVTTPGGASTTLTITFTDDVAMDAGSISNATGAVTVTGPNGPLTVTLTNVSSNVNGPQITATYSVAAPGGAWSAAANGTYTASIAGGTITDTGGNALAGATLGTFDVNVVPGAPTATLTPVSDVVSAGGTAQSFTVTYTAATGETIDTGTIDVNDVSVAKSGGSALTVTGVSVSGSGATVTATYTVTAAGGAWDSGDNGSYVIGIVAAQVRSNTSAAVPAGAVGSFTVNISTPGDTGTPIGDFGVVGRKNVKRTFTDGDGTKIVLTLSGGGTGHASFRDGRIDLVLEGTTAKSTLSLSGKGGDGRITIGDITAAGGLGSISIPTGDLEGTISLPGTLKKGTVGNLAGSLQTAGAVTSLEVRGNLTGTAAAGTSLGKLTVRGGLTGSTTASAAIASADVRGTLSGSLRAGTTIGKLTVGGALTGDVVAAAGIASVDARGGFAGGLSAGGILSKLSVRGTLAGQIGAAGGIGSLAVSGNVTAASIFAGAALGANAAVGGGDDSFAAGAIAKFSVSGSVTNSLIAAGATSATADAVTGGSASIIRSISVKRTVSDSTRFVAGAFGKIKAPGAINPATDPRFEVL